jgi:hypothetical protein
MLTLFNTDRELTRLAADAAHIAQLTGVDDQPWRHALPARGHDNMPPAFQETDPSSGAKRLGRERLVHMIEAVVVGDPYRLGEVLTPDAIGWSPTLQFASRAEAEAALDECDSRLSIARFSIDRLWWSSFNAFAEWSAEVVPTGPFLVGDDVLIDSSERRVFLVGASVVYLAGDRIAAIHTYFDDAALIEQLLLDGPDS